MAIVALDHENTSTLDRGNLAVDLAALPGVWRLGNPASAEAPSAPPSWTRDELAGRLCELAAGPDTAALTAAFALVLDAQVTGSPVAWVTARAAIFNPPDVAASGVDLASLVVVRTDSARRAGRAADVLLRSGAFGLVVLELGTSAVLPTPLQGRLVQLARKHDAAVLCLTQKTAAEPSLGSLVSLRAQARRQRVPGGFRCELEIDKDKRRGPGWRWRERFRGPDGLH
ncbi:recombinase A [bacterium]|nr:MAG: recombinase A [bacterium]